MKDISKRTPCRGCRVGDKTNTSPLPFCKACKNLAHSGKTPTFDQQTACGEHWAQYFITMNDLIYFKNSIPFEPSSYQVIYIENQYNERINTFIRENHESLRAAFAKIHHEFCYLPALTKTLRDKALIDYFTPYLSDVVQDFSLSNDFLNPYAIEGTDLSPAFITVDRFKSKRKQWEFIALRISDGEPLPEQVDAILNVLKERRDKYYEGIRYCNTEMIESGESHSVNYADMKFPIEVTKLMDEVQEKIDQLRQYGVSEMVLNRLLRPQISLSRLTVTDSFRILLPDYGNREIKMTPLVKAVFLLFLRHPEGIVFKTLPDYRNELLDIYRHLSGRESYDKIYKSVRDVTDPCSNSINEKCARIREAFVREFDDRLAEHYYVTGTRGGTKTILLPRELVYWETNYRYYPPKPIPIIDPYEHR